MRPLAMCANVPNESATWYTANNIFALVGWSTKRDKTKHCFHLPVRKSLDNSALKSAASPNSNGYDAIVVDVDNLVLNVVGTPLTIATKLQPYSVIFKLQHTIAISAIEAERQCSDWQRRNAGVSSTSREFITVRKRNHN